MVTRCTRDLRPVETVQGFIRKTSVYRCFNLFPLSCYTFTSTLTLPILFSEFIPFYPHLPRITSHVQIHIFIMQLSLLPVSLFLSLAAAQTSSTGSTSVCAAQSVLEACLSSTQAILAGCSSTDYDCLCQKTNDVLTYAIIPYSSSPVPPAHQPVSFLLLTTFLL